MKLEFNHQAIRLPFGKYANQFLSEIPQSYLEWAEENLIFPAISFEINEELSRRRSNRPGAGKVVRKGK